MKDNQQRQLDRRTFFKMAGIAAAGLGLAACAPAPAGAPTAAPTSASSAPAASTPVTQAPASSPYASAIQAEANAQLYEAAKKEGELVVYTTGSQPEWDEVSAAFQKKYPGIKLSSFIGTDEADRDKILTEAKALTSCSRRMRPASMSTRRMFRHARELILVRWRMLQK